MLQLRVSNEWEYPGWAEDLERVKLQDNLHMDEIVISRSDFIKKRSDAMPIFRQELGAFWYEAGLLQKADI